MDQEIAVACRFIRERLPNDLPKSQTSRFEVELREVLKRLYTGHWYPEEPSRGSGYRCLASRNGVLDRSILQAAETASIDLALFVSAFPVEHSSIWVDPADVSYRLYERAPIICLWQRGKYCDSQQANLAPPVGPPRRTAHQDVGRAFTRRDFNSQLTNATPFKGPEPKKASCWSSNYFPSGGSATVFSIDSEVDHGMELPRMDAYPSSLDSPYSSRSSSPPSSMSPDTSEEEDLLSREDTLQRNNGLAFGVHWTQAEQRRAFAKKSSGLSGTAPVFAPRTVHNNNNANNHHHHHHHQPHSSHPHWHHSSRLGAERPLQQARA